MSSDKRVDGVEEYSYKGTDYLLVRTRDEWLYRFTRPNNGDNHGNSGTCPPYRFEKKQRPDGTWSDHDTRTPDAVVKFLELNYDVAQLHPQKKRQQRSFNA